MSIPLVINGAVFEYPQNFDEDWGVDATGWAQAVTSGMLQMAGGNFPLTAQVDFGSSFGIKVLNIASKTANPASAGYMRLGKTDIIEWRNNANSANLTLAIDGSDNLTFNGTPLGTTSLTNGDIFVGNASNVPVGVAMSGDATLTNTGVITIANSAITNAKVSASASIATSKLAPLTASRAVVSDSGGLLAASAVTSTEMGYLSGVTSNIQTQLGTYLPLAGGTMSGAIAMASHKITSLTNGTAANDAAAYGQLQLIQTIQATTTTSTTTTSTTYANTALAGSITPTSASNRVKITVSGNLLAGTGATLASVSLKRGSSVLASGPGFQSISSSLASGISIPVGFSYIDSPATTSITAYHVAIRSGDNSTSVTFLAENETGVIILEEIV